MKYSKAGKLSHVTVFGVWERRGKVSHVTVSGVWRKKEKVSHVTVDGTTVHGRHHNDDDVD